MPKTKTKKDVDLRTLPREKRPAPTSGQSGQPLDLSWNQLNKDEQRVLKALCPPGDPNVVASIGTIAKAFRAMTTLKVRNALRRLVRSDLVKNTDRGAYKATAKGQRYVKVNDDAASTKTAGRVAAPKVVRAPLDVNIDDIKLRVQSDLPGHEQTETIFQSGVIAAVASKLGMSDSKIAAATGYSRGFIIPRIKRLRATGADSATFMSQVAAAAKVAEGLSDSL